MVWLLDVGNNLMVCLGVSTQYRPACDEQTDGRTDGHLATACVWRAL